jgi:hypothetical protein
MTNLIKMPGVIAMLLILSSCSTTYWYKLNAGQSEWVQTSSGCLSESTQTVPVALVQTMTPGRWKSTKHCDKKQNNQPQNCWNEKTYIEPSVEVHDANVEVRNQSVKACLWRNGWSETEDSPYTLPF